VKKHTDFLDTNLFVSEERLLLSRSCIIEFEVPQCFQQVGNDWYCEQMICAAKKKKSLLNKNKEKKGTSYEKKSKTKMGKTDAKRINTTQGKK
jgi:hypothetical protein